MTTFNEIIIAFETFSDEHHQINTFYSGQTWNFQTQTNLYPAVIMLPESSSMEKGSINLSFNLFIADILNSDRTNLDEIYSDTLQILADFVSYFDDAYENNEIEFFLNSENISIHPFEEKFDDVVAGWMAKIEINIPYSGNICVIPK